MQSLQFEATSPRVAHYRRFVWLNNEEECSVSATRAHFGTAGVACRDAAELKPEIEPAC
jgi:hypothetical protein